MSKRPPFHYAGKTALITGASAGIGEEYARQLAARSMDLVLVARREERLNRLANELEIRHRIRAHVIPTDLGAPDAVPSLVREIASRGIEIHLLINNAGIGTTAALIDIDLERVREELSVNVVAMVELVRLLASQMVARRQGGIINTASAAAVQPLPFASLYAASKAFILSFSVATHVELRQHGVRVAALCPGTTATDFFDANEAQTMLRLAGSQVRTAQDVVETALKALDDDKASVVDGRLNRAMVGLNRLIPAHWLAKTVGKAMQADFEKRGV